MRVSAQRSSQVIEMALPGLHGLEAPARERRALRVPDARFHLPLAVGVGDAARQRGHAVVGEHITVERIERRVVPVRSQHALLQIVEDHHARGATEAAKRLLMELGPDARTRPQRQQPHRLPAVAERQHEQPAPPVLAGGGIAHHRPVTVVDLRFVARGGLDHRSGHRWGRPAQ
jgi:hypothetical protein